MANVLLLILLIISIILTGLILIQRSEGGALGIGGGGGGGLMSGRSAADSVVRMTGVLGAAFLICSLLLSIAFERENRNTSILDETRTGADAPLTFDADSGDETDPLDNLFSDDPADEST
ncbi:MAG: preprotein translocase subunit SecG, partial [Hyphomonadaceae bacterium]|nr:preprotein translocase subunit SecG [Hyphomonadaceae bacterium]